MENLPEPCGGKRRFGENLQNEFTVESVFYPPQKRRRLTKRPIPKPKSFNLRREILEFTDNRLELLEWVRVWWPRQNCWYRAQVCQLEPLVVTYEDGEKEWLGTDSVFNIEKYGSENNEDPMTNPRLQMESKVKRPELYSRFNGARFQNFTRTIQNDAACWILNGSDFSWTWCSVKGVDCESLKDKKILKVVVQGDTTIHKVDPNVNDCFIFDYKLQKLEKLLINLTKARLNGKSFKLPPPKSNGAKKGDEELNFGPYKKSKKLVGVYPKKRASSSSPPKDSWFVHILFRGCMYHVGCFPTQEAGAAARDMFLLRNATEKELQTRKMNYPERMDEFRRLIRTHDSPETGIAKTVTPVKQRSRKQRLAAKKKKEEQKEKEQKLRREKEQRERERRKRKELKRLKASLAADDSEDEEKAQEMTTTESEEEEAQQEQSDGEESDSSSSQATAENEPNSSEDEDSDKMVVDDVVDVDGLKKVRARVKGIKSGRTRTRWIERAKFLSMANAKESLKLYNLKERQRRTKQRRANRRKLGR